MAATRRLFEGLTFKLADDGERERALDLRRRIYTAELGDPGIDRFDTVAAHLIATDAQGIVVSTLRVVGPQERPFDLERFVPLDPILTDESRPAEVSRFCVEPNHRAIHRGQLVHLGMLKLLYEFARQQGITDLLTLGLPDLETLYKIAFFIPMNVMIEHPTWGHVRVMHFNMAKTRSENKTSRHPIARLLFSTRVPNIVI